MRQHWRDYSKRQALEIYDESVRFEREVRGIVMSSTTVVGFAAGSFGLFMLTQTLQRGQLAEEVSPTLMVIPATGQLLSTAFGALLAVILAVWFSPNSFRLGRSEDPATIARELSTQRSVTFIARMCTFLALGVGLWGFVSSVTSSGPAQVDLVRTIAPPLLGLGLCWWAAAAEVRVGVSPSRQLLRAQYRRESKRLRDVIERASPTELSPRGRLAQRLLAFIVIPVCAWAAGLWLVPPPSLATGATRLAMSVVVSYIGYRALLTFLFFVIGRHVWSAAAFMGMFALVGLALSAVAMAATLPITATADATPLGPVGRSVLLFSVITLSGPIVLLAVLTSRRLFGRTPGLIYDSVMRRYRKELAKAVDRSLASGREPGKKMVAPDRKMPFPWAAVVSLAPVIPFSFVLAAAALRDTQGTRARGRTTAIVGIILGVAVSGTIVGIIVYVAWLNPSLVYCELGEAAVCLK